MSQPIIASRARHRDRTRQNGQTTIFVLLALAIFMLGFIGFGVDMTNLFFRRQKAQGAADAACQACAMNLLAHYSGSPTPGMGFTPGTAFDCAGSPSSAPCQYAALNGYNGSGLVANTESNSVTFTFPGSVPGVTPPDASLAAFPFVQTTVTDQARVFFSSLLTGSRTQLVGASAICGLVQANAPVPIIVLNPTCSHALQISGSGTTKIVGGPTKSIQVNSMYNGASGCAAATTNAGNGCASAGPTIDLSKGGPAYTGSSFGVFGANANQIVVPAGFIPGSTGNWLVPSSPVPDPYALTPAPAVPGTDRTGPDHVDSHLTGLHGCPDHTQDCAHYLPGRYTQPIVVKNVTAIFDPGIYYLEPTTYTAANGGLDNCGSSGTGCLPGNPPSGGQCAYDMVVDSNGVVRMSNQPGDGSGGLLFYLSGPNSGPHPFGSVFFGANAGNSGGRTVDQFPTAGMNCDGTSPDPALGIPSAVDGNVLLGQCTDGGNYRPYDGVGDIRGILYFQDRRNGYGNGQASMQGGGGLVLSGTLYFHNCKSSDSTGVACDPPPPAAAPNGYQSFFQLQGSPGGGTYVLGNITTDQFIIAGNGDISMQLDPNPVYHILKATLLQ